MEIGAIRMIFKIFLSIFFPLLVLWECKSGYKQEYQRAYSLFAKKELDSIQKAVEKFDDAIRYAIAALQGKYEALLGLGTKYMELKMYSAATKVFLEASQIKPEDPSVYYFLGLSYANDGGAHFSQKERETLYGFAEKMYKHGELLDPNHLPMQYAMGIFYGLLKNDVSKGLDYLKKVLEKSPLHVDSLFAAGGMYTQLGQWSQAWDCYEKIEKSYPKTDFSRKAKENLGKIRRFLR